MDFGDSHEWTMWKAQQDAPPRRAKTLKEWEAWQKPPSRRREPAKRRKTSWAVRMQKRLSAWVKGKPDTALEELLGYSAEQLRHHLHRQFNGGMKWSNYAGNCEFRAERRVWVIDHIVPKRLFREDEASNAFALSNLRPLWITENMSKNLRRTHLI